MLEDGVGEAKKKQSGPSGKNLGVQTGLRAEDEEQMNRWRAAAAKMGLTFAEWARAALDKRAKTDLGKL